jgi:DNA repair protein RadD
MSSTGDFNESALQAAVDDADVTYKALTEAVQIGQSRRSWLAFASGIDHAIHIAEMLRGTFGIDAAEVHSKMPEKERDRRIDAYKRGELRCIVNKDILTTGFDHPPIDLILMLRPTMSTGLWVQMLGRGTRPYDPAFTVICRASLRRNDCCVLDYAGNTRRLGPINDPVIPKPKGKGRAGDAPVKICDACGAYNHTSARFCLVCNNEFVMSPNIVATAGTDELLRSDLPVVEYFDVDRVVYSDHTSRAGNKSIKASYFCGLRTFYEYVTVEGDGFRRKAGRDWFRQRAPIEPPETNAEILANSRTFVYPRRIRVWLKQAARTASPSRRNRILMANWKPIFRPKTSKSSRMRSEVPWAQNTMDMIALQRTCVVCASIGTARLKLVGLTESARPRRYRVRLRTIRKVIEHGMGNRNETEEPAQGA